ncbi:MAG: tyrosine-type recombinase/integrase [Flavobacteriales bacterium]
MELVEANPVKGIVKPKKPQRLPHYVEERSLEDLYEKHFTQETSTDFESTRNALIIKLFYETGIRQAELLGITDRDLDFSIGQIKILGKRNKMRYVPVGKDMLADLSNYIRFRDEVFGHSNEGNLFVSNKGQKISKSLVYQIVKSYLSTVTTQSKKSPHVLRHSFATHMLNHGADLNVIKELLGHSSLAATQVYTHNSIEKLKGVHSKLHPRSK